MKTTGVPVVVTGGETGLKRHSNRLAIVDLDGDVLATLPASMVSNVFVCGQVGWTASVGQLLLQQRVPVAFCDRLGRVRGRLEVCDARAGDLVMAQVQIANRPDARLRFARSIVTAKIANQRTAIMRYERTGMDASSLRESLHRFGVAAGRARSVEELRGIEGSASRVYFGSIRSLLSSVTSFPRRDRSGADIVNAMINYTSALLREAVYTAVVAEGLEPQIGIFHEVYRRRPALVFDLMEEWRAVLLEPTVVALLRLRAVTPGDLVVEGGNVVLSHRARRHIAARFCERAGVSDGVRPTRSALFGDQIRRQAALAASAIRTGDEYIGYRSK